MGPSVRAKFRVLGIEHRYDGLFLAELKPVMNKAGNNYEENKTFWEYSPNGESRLTFSGKHNLEVGAYYYIDIEQVEFPKDGDNSWLLNDVSRHSDGGGEVFLSWYRSYDHHTGRPDGLLSGNLKIGMDKKAQGAMLTLSQPGTKWTVIFTLADPSDG